MPSGDDGPSALSRWFDRQLRAWRCRWKLLWWTFITVACAASLLGIANGVFLSWSSYLRDAGLHVPMHYTRFFVRIWMVQKPIEDYFAEWYLLLGLLVGWSLCLALSVPDEVRHTLPKAESYRQLLTRRRRLLLIVLAWIIILPTVTGYLSYTGNFHYSDQLYPFLGWSQLRLVLRLVFGTWLTVEFCAFCQMRLHGWQLFLLSVVLPVAIEWTIRLGAQLIYVLRLQDLMQAGIDPFADSRPNSVLQPESLIPLLATFALLIYFRWRNNHPRTDELEKL